MQGNSNLEGELNAQALSLVNIISQVSTWNFNLTPLYLYILSE